MIPWITEAELLFSVRPQQAVDAIRAMLQGNFDPEDDQQRTSVELRNGQLLLMPAEVGDYAGIKIASVSPDNPARGQPRIQGIYLLHDAVTLAPKAVLDGVALTTLRTPAVSVAAVGQAVKTRFAEGASVLVYGAGPQALGHVRTLNTQVPLREVVIAVRRPDRAQRCVTAVTDLGINTRIIDARSAQATAEVRRADLIIAATTASEPLFDGRLVSDRAILIAVGSHDVRSREFDEQLMARATVVVESKGSALRECGDVVMAMEAGRLTAEDLVPMKQVILSGGSRLDPARPVVFKGSGMAWEDLSVAVLAYEMISRDGGR